MFFMMCGSRSRRPRWQFLLCIGLGLLFIYWCSRVGYDSYYSRSLIKPSNSKIILAYTLFFDNERVYEPAEECEFKCLVTYDKGYLPHADLLIFHQWDIKFWDLPDSAAPKIFFTEESPMFKKFKYLFPPRKDAFNYIMSYMANSDVVWPYDHKAMYAGKKRTREEIRAIIAKKSKMALSARSNCATNSKREVLIGAMAKHVEVTTIGKCGREDCNWECLEREMESHHFYLAFENAVCEDYVTEKFYRFTSYIVPIVLRRHIIPKRIPSDVFIAVDDFQNVKELTDYLTYLTKNTTAYERYFDWAIRGDMAERYDKKDPGCRLCELAYKRPQKSIADFNSIINDTKYCDNTFVEKFIGI
ncbi:unnamed protein product [Bursaphelenchus xylophilus]|uniref:Fucosyltransferase n=1 Tax=Bursaphelenchus xylophilus TaxID=6326 RepID=A0A1I7RVW8_BURXY|nr:unnamed protein product [Bursaphelenchus xylophilus]CAG9094803.1 unnamed protein product [Bursaphelenchus xylophilus]